ncbi:MAG: carbohydrate ABC transporter permease [Lachnospiraceae bacterium]
MNKKIKSIVYNVLVAVIGFIMIYPLLWMVMSSFKETNTIFLTASSLIPEKFTFSNYVTGWKGFAKIGFGTFFKNSAFISVIATFGTVISSSLVAFGLSRCRFRGRKVLFTAVLLTMMVPSQVIMVPQYIWYQKLGWVGTYLPLIVPYFFAIQGFFVYMIYNFLEGIPKELDEAAKIDGCSFYGVYVKVAMPLAVPSLVTTGIFSFIWRWDDFMSALLYIDKAAKYPVSLALKLFADPASTSDYGAMFAMSTLSILPILIIFMFFQKYLVDGVATSGLKG